MKRKSGPGSFSGFVFFLKPRRFYSQLGPESDSLQLHLIDHFHRNAFILSYPGSTTIGHLTLLVKLLLHGGHGGSGHGGGHHMGGGGGGGRHGGWGGGHRGWGRRPRGADGAANISIMVDGRNYPEQLEQ